MRTTLTLDDDVAVRLERLRRNGRTFKEVVNEVMRVGLDALENPPRQARRSYTTPVDMGELLVPSLDDVWGALDARRRAVEMILVDANLLIYAFTPSAPEHVAARTWLDQALTGRSRVGIPWESLVAFLRVVTHPRLLAPNRSGPRRPGVRWRSGSRHPSRGSRCRQIDTSRRSERCSL